jgi:polar amino acid transport system substrate-binding protein
MGEVDAIAGDEAKISYLLNQAIKDKTFRFLNDSIYTEDVSVAVNKGDTILFNILNKGILESKENNQYMHIHSKWFGSFMPEVRDLSDYNDIGNIIILIIAIVFLFGSWNYVISSRVYERTKELNHSRKELRDVIDSLHEGLMVYGEDGIILECNNSMTKILNLSRLNIINKRFEELEELSPFLEHINDKESFQLAHSYYLVMLRRLETLSDLKLFIIEDYTERHKYELISRQDAKMIAVGELSAGLAHEIRNPLGLIKNYLFVLRKRYDDDLSLHAMSVIDDSVKRIHNLISNLLNFSRLSKEDSKEVNIDVLFNSIIALASKNIRDNDVKLSVVKSEDMPDKLFLNEDVLKLGIINLINNSIDSFDGTDIVERMIQISLKINKEKLIIDFQDNGKGIPSSELEKIFNPFYTTKDTGTGLGIYILASELAAIEGSITCESEQYVGTIFHITLPIKGV